MHQRCIARMHPQPRTGHQGAEVLVLNRVCGLREQQSCARLLSKVFVGGFHLQL